MNQKVDIALELRLIEQGLICIRRLLTKFLRRCLKIISFREDPKFRLCSNRIVIRTTKSKFKIGHRDRVRKEVSLVQKEELHSLTKEGDDSFTPLTFSINKYFHLPLTN